MSFRKILYSENRHHFGLTKLGTISENEMIDVIEKKIIYEILTYLEIQITFSKTWHYVYYQNWKNKSPKSHII